MANMKKQKRKKKIYCEKCVHLLLIKKSKILPLCLARALFRGGTLRRKIDVVDVAFAESRNRCNHCKFYKRKNLFSMIFSLKKEIREWLRRSLNAKEAKIEEYSIEEESRKKYNSKKRQKIQFKYGDERTGNSIEIDKGIYDNRRLEDFDSGNKDNEEHNSGIDPPIEN